MALVRKALTPYTTLQGIISQDIYMVLNNIVIDCINNQATINLDIYASKAIYEAGKDALESESILVTGADYDNYLSDAAIQPAGNDACSQAYKYILEWRDGESKLVFGDNWEYEG